MSENTSNAMVTVAPAKRFVIEFFVPDDCEDEMGFHIAEGVLQALPGILATRCIDVTSVGFIGTEFIQRDGRRYLMNTLFDKLTQGNLEYALGNMPEL